MSNAVRILFASCAPERVPAMLDQARTIAPELPLVVVSEFQPAEGEWIPYQPYQTAKENLERIRAKLSGRPGRVAIAVLGPERQYAKLRGLALRSGAPRVMAVSPDVPPVSLRPPDVAGLVRYARVALRRSPFLKRQVDRLRHPKQLQQPLFYRAAMVAGMVVSHLKRRAPEAPAPAIGHALPDGISVVIPSRNGRSLLAECLPPVMAQLDPANTEVIVVDNGSDDGTAAAFPQLVIEYSGPPLSFARAVNRGLARARFSHVCLLNNDMLVDSGFFQALRTAFFDVPDLFCATAQIFLPEGERREETGKAVMPRTPPAGAFPILCELPVEGENLSYVLYGSGGASLYDTAKLRALGGLSPVFEPAYVEDLDLGFNAWRSGWPTVFVAGARTLHRHRTTTSRYYSEDQLARVLERNYLRFLARSVTDPGLFRELWDDSIRRLNLAGKVDVLREAAAAPSWMEPRPTATIPEREVLAIGSGSTAVFAGRQRGERPLVLVASPYLPFPLSHGGAVRMYNLLRRAARDFDQVLVCFADELLPAPTELLDICAEIILVKRFGTHALPSTDRPAAVEEFDSPAFHAVLRQTVRKWRPRIAQLEFTQMAQYAGDCRPARTLLVEHDITLDLYAQLLAQQDDWETRQQHERWIRFEHQAWERVDRVVTMSEKDRRSVSGAHAVALPNGVDVQRFQPSDELPEPRRILFIGSFAHLPNLLAIDFFLRECWPHLEDCALHVIAGSRPQYFLERYAGRVQPDLAQPGIELEGFVADVRPAYRRAEVVVAPLLASAGTNIKIMEAMAMGKAIVSTPAGINGLDELQDGADVLLAESGPDMALAIQDLLSNSARRRAIEQAARRTAVERYDWDVIEMRQVELYRSLLS